MQQQTHLARDYKFEMVPLLQESHYYSPSHCCPNYNNIAVLYNLAQQHNHCFFFFFMYLILPYVKQNHFFDR